MVAAAAPAYCLIVGLIVSAMVPGAAVLTWVFTAIFGAVTLLPQALPRPRAFRVMCWVSTGLVAVLVVVSFVLGAFLFLPAVVPLVLAARPGRS